MTDRSARPTAAVLLLCAASLLLACDAPSTVRSFSGPTMGSSYNVVVEWTGGASDTASLEALVGGELARVERAMSTYDPRSDVSRFSDYEGVEAMPVDAYLVDVVRSALEVARASSGAFDPTVAGLVEAWGFGPVDGPLPDSATVARMRERVGYGRLTVDDRAGTISKDTPGVAIDLSGIAKGFAAERIVGRLEALGYQSALVDVGGELRVLGTHADGRPWRVALEGPGDAAPTVLGTIDLVDEAIATSGDFRNFYEDDGVLYAHIIDPRTGFPIQFRGFSVSVVHSDAALADAWATALTVLGPEEGFGLAEQEQLAALFAWRESGALVTRATAAMQGRLTQID